MGLWHFCILLMVNKGNGATDTNCLLQECGWAGKAVSGVPARKHTSWWCSYACSPQLQLMGNSSEDWCAKSPFHFPPVSILGLYTLGMRAAQLYALLLRILTGKLWWLALWVGEGKWIASCTCPGKYRAFLSSPIILRLKDKWINFIFYCCGAVGLSFMLRGYS